MDLRQLQTFQAVVEHGSFLRAAEALLYAQSTITLHIQQLENDLGVPLFARQGKKAQLTEAGRLLAVEAAQILGRVEALRRTMCELAEGEAGYVRLGAIFHDLPYYRHRCIIDDIAESLPEDRVGKSASVIGYANKRTLSIGIGVPGEETHHQRIEQRIERPGQE